MSLSLLLFLAFIQGLTEFLPVSSSGHLIVFSWLFSGKELPLSLNVALHLGTTLAVLIYFHKDWLQLISGSFQAIKEKNWNNQSFSTMTLLFVGSIPAGVVGLLFKDAIERVLHHPIVVAVPLILVGFLLWIVDVKSDSSKTIKDLKLLDGFLVGCAQMCALIPGVSRSGATILAGRALNLSRKDAAKFSFLLGTPAMLGAALVHAKGFLASMNDPHFYYAISVSFLSGLFAIKILLKLLETYGFLSFAIYRLFIGVLVIYSIL